MAKVHAFKRSTSQPVAIDTVAGTTTNIGATITGVQTTSLFPARCVNLETTFGGDTYAILLTATGSVQVNKYNGTAWSIVGGPYAPPVGHTYTPLCIHVVNNTIVALWTDVSGSGDGIRAAASTNGTSWTAVPNGTAAINGSLGGHSVVYRSAIVFATATGIWAIAPLHRTITLTAPPGTPYQVGELVTGSITFTTAIVRDFSGSTLKLDTLTSGTGDFNVGETLTGTLSGATGTVSANTMYVNPIPDIGNDGGLSGSTGPANLLGSFASWDGTLYFVQPRTVAGPTKFYRLNPSWSPTLILPSPQWTSISFNGLPDVSFATLTNDGGVWALFVNNNDQLSLLFSGATSTKLAVASSQVLPLQFTDVTNSLLPTALAIKTNLGVCLYDDDRRRTKNLQWLLVRDLAAASTYICPWDGTAQVAIASTLTGVDYILPFTHHGEEPTFTNYAPTVSITAVSQPFPGRVRIDYKVRCNPAHPVDVFGEYSIDGDSFFPMSEGDGDSGSQGLTTSPSGNSYFFFWDAFVDLQGDYSNLGVRMLARISGL